ncbi:MAG: substrate-binding domain-containing protein [Anaerolineae bacterium]
MSGRESNNHNVTIYDIARESGVSYSTVSRVLNGFEYVKDVTRERVLAAAERLGYVANLQARSLAGGKSNVIGLLVPKIDNSYITEIVAGIDDELANNDLNLMMYTTHRHSGKEKQFVNTILGSMTDGLLLLVPLATGTYVQALRERQFPYVLIDQHDSESESSEVLATNYQGAYEATSYLIQLGHQRIAFITGLVELYSTHERLAGYKAALRENGLSFYPEYVVRGDFWEIEAYRATQELLALPNRPTAIFAANDLTAMGAMNALRDHHLSVPEDMSIIGFDDISSAALTNPRLTTVRQPLEQMGRSAVELLLEQIRNPERPKRRVTLATELIVRGSCQPLHP